VIASIGLRDGAAMAQVNRLRLISSRRQQVLNQNGSPFSLSAGIEPATFSLGNQRFVDDTAFSVFGAHFVRPKSPHFSAACSPKF